VSQRDTPAFSDPGSKNPGPGGIPGLLYSATVEAGVGGVDFSDFWGPGVFSEIFEFIDFYCL
jgi:hypothetical protein